MSVSAVYVLNMRGQTLMSTTTQKARILLKNGHTKVVNLSTFTTDSTTSTAYVYNLSTKE